MLGQKTGGRTKGTPNKVTGELRDALKVIIAGELDTLADTLAQLPPKERLDILLRLMPFALPKVDAITGTYDTGWVLD
jgi:hypothetical protein